MPTVTALLGESIKDVALLFLIFGGAGALEAGADRWRGEPGRCRSDARLHLAPLRAGLGYGGSHSCVCRFLDRVGHHHRRICYVLC